MIPYLACMLAVSATLHLPPRILPTLSVLEGGAPGSVHENANGTADLGVMQVNTLWVPAIAARAHVRAAQARRLLVADPCFNIAAAGLILRGYYAQAGDAWLPAIGDYHSHTPPLHDAYVADAEQKAAALFGSK
jgi:hypothetical protein